MTEVVNEVLIAGPIEPVFDLVTTTRYWPRWHPATESVTGVTERPLQFGDEVTEQARIGGRLHEGTWTVTEHERPRRVVLQIDRGRLQIAYDFEAHGEQTKLERLLAYRPTDFAGGDTDPDGLAARMYSQSETALQRLKQLVERELAS